MPNFEAGDWNCSACGDHQFSRNTVCRKCGNPKDAVDDAGDAGGAFGGRGVVQPFMPMKQGGKGGGKDGGAQNFAAGDMCWAGGKGNNGAQNFAPGDWCCSACGDHQFARNTSCRRCGNPKNAPPPQYGCQGKGAMGGSMPLSNGPAMKPGDWICPSCSDHQFSRNSACRRCGEPKPEESADGGMNQFDPAMMQQLMPMMMQQMQNMGVLGNAPCGGGGGGGKGAGGGNGQKMKPGDWICPQCQDLQFARNAECRLCNTARPADAEGGFEAGRGRSRSPRRGAVGAGADNFAMPVAAGKGW